MCVSTATQEQKTLQMDWECKKCGASGTITYPMGELPALMIERLMTSHEEATERECVYSQKHIEVSHAREVTNEE